MEKALEEIAAAPFEAQELRQLGGGDIERRAGLEARHDRIGEEIGEVGQAEEAAAKGDHADHEGDGGRQGRRPRRIAGAEGGDAGGDGERQCRGRAHRQLPARSEHGIGEARGEVAVKAGNRRQAGQRGIGQRFGNDEGGERQAGDAVRPQPLQRVASEPFRYGQYFSQPHGFSSSGCVVQLSTVAPPGGGRRSTPDRRTSSCPNAPAA